MSKSSVNVRLFLAGALNLFAIACLIEAAYLLLRGYLVISK